MQQEVFKRSQLLVVSRSAWCYLFSWTLVLLELFHQLTPVGASSFAGQNPFAAAAAAAGSQHESVAPQATVWAQHQNRRHQRHLQQQQQDDDHQQASQQRAIASLRQLISGADRAPHLWNVDLLAADQESASGAAANFNTNYALPAPLSAAQHQHQLQPPSASSLGSTAPSVNRQLVAPPPFYELALAPTSGLQFDSADSPTNTNINAEDPASGSMNMRLAAAFRQHFRNAEAEQRNSNQAAASDSFTGRPSSSLMARSLASGGQSSGGGLQEAADEPPPVLDSSKSSADGTEPKNSSDEPAAAPASDDKVIEPRQRRRIFNRILKKAEWNHLFVELSKVFLKYFLDLALKDIIGKQSGAETTTSRKKLDAQSELTDLLKDFFKTAISNI